MKSSLSEEVTIEIMDKELEDIRNLNSYEWNNLRKIPQAIEKNIQLKTVINSKVLRKLIDLRLHP